MWVSYYADMGQNVQRYAMPYFFCVRVSRARRAARREILTARLAERRHRHSTMKRGQGQAKKVFVTGLI